MKNEPKCAWIVHKVDWGRQKVQAARNSGLDMKESEPKWLDFKIIDRVFRLEDRDWEHMMVCEINGGIVNVKAEKERFNTFLRNSFFAMISRDNMEEIPDYLDLPEIEEVTVSESSQSPMPGVYLEEDIESDSSWVTAENDLEELKSEELKKEEWMKEESKFEDFEELSQESLAESQEILDKLEKTENEPKVKEEATEEEEEEEENKGKKKKLPRRKAKSHAQKAGAFSKYF